MICLILLGCYSGNRFQFDPYNPKIQYSELMLPSWLMHFPNSPDYAIGVSYVESDKSNMIKVAKEFASVQINRNKNSIIVRKYSRTYSDHARFEVNVSSNVDNLQNCFDNLILIESAIVNNHYIALFKLKNSTSVHYNNNLISNQTSKSPIWFKENKITAGDQIYTTAESSSENLTIAFEKAFEKCRLQIADYLEKNIESILINYNNENKKFISIETDMLLSNLIITNIYISAKTYDSLSTYSVYVKMQYQDN